MQIAGRPDTTDYSFHTQILFYLFSDGRKDREKETFCP
ncbi:hypothetical protein A343_1287 [Porphyromonas gingivalis JCVI SC001]|nr:hypothetical protein A343_1287 [Porphyromonas gingivalis JCVI SC001]